MVGAAVAVAYALASFGTTEAIPATLGPFLLWMFGLGAFAHLANRHLAPAADPVFLPVALLLNGLGYVVITRLDGSLAALQSTWTAIGVGGYVATLLFLPRVRIIEQYRYLLGIGGLLLLMIPLVPGLGTEINGARIWASIGPINFQPGEFAKLTLAAFFAGYLVDSRELLRSRLELRDLAPIGVAWAGSLGVMVFQRDLGSSLLFFTLFVVVLWVASERWVVLAVGAVLFFGGAFAAWTMFDHVQKRVDIWLDPFKDPKGDGFQIVEGSFALADGGLTGTGLGQGEPGRIPFAETDFIFAAIGEELGLAGSSAVLMAFLLLVGSGLRVSLRADRVFEKLFALGLTTLLAVQTFVIVGGVLRVVRSPVSPCPSSATAVRRSSPTMSCLRCSFACHMSSGSRSVRRRARVNLRIRRLGVVLACCIWCCSCSSTGSSSSVRTPAGRRQQHAGLIREFGRSAARSSPPMVCLSPDRSSTTGRSTSVGVPRGGALRTSPAISRSTSRPLDSNAATTTNSPAIRSTSALPRSAISSSIATPPPRSRCRSATMSSGCGGGTRRPQGLGRRARSADRRDHRSVDVPQL